MGVSKGRQKNSVGIDKKWEIRLQFRGPRVAQIAGADRPNNLKCFTIAFGGVIAVIKWGRQALNHALSPMSEFYARKSGSNHLRHLVPGTVMHSQWHPPVLVNFCPLISG